MANVTNLSKAEYLKRYISGESTDKKTKKKKKKVPTVAPRSTIVDDDVDFKTLLPSNLENTLEEDVGDNEPTIAGFVDERPEDIKLLECYRESDGHWKGLDDPISSKRTGNGSGYNQLLSKRVRHDSDSDQSLPRRGRHDSDSDQSLPRRGRHDSDSDQSLPRRGRHDSDSDQSLPRRGRHDSDSDQSLPRRGRHDSDSDQSLPRRGRNDSDSDQSLPRRGRTDSDSDQSPPRRGRNDSGTDLSPKRSKKTFTKVKSETKSKNYDSDQSPPRKSAKSNESLTRRQKYGSDSDQSPARKQKIDKKSPRRHKHSSEHSPQTNISKRKRKSRFDSDDHTSNSPNVLDSEDKMKKTLSGKKAGLSSARDMKREAELLKQREEDAFKKIDKEKLGREATTVFRDKSGKRRNFREEEKDRAEEDAKKAVEDAKYKEWGQGLKQKADQETRLMDHLHEMSKPLARYRDDSDLDSMLREQDREGDPMLAFLSKKKKKQNQSGGKELPVYKGPAGPPNRFGIKPGYRWDGVNRSNGFENQLFSKMSSRKATATDAYKWSTEDM